MGKLTKAALEAVYRRWEREEAESIDVIEAVGAFLGPVRKPRMLACLTYYHENRDNPNRVQLPPYDFTMREVNYALDRGWLCVGPGGWHVTSEAGHAALKSEEPRQ